MSRENAEEEADILFAADTLEKIAGKSGKNTGFFLKISYNKYSVVTDQLA